MRADERETTSVRHQAETVREVCAEITEATMRVGAFFTPTIYEWRDRILAAYEREMAEKDAEIARLKAALKPVMKIKKQPVLGLLHKAECAEAVLEAQRVMLEGGEK